MPPADLGNLGGNPVANWYNSVPPITRAIGTAAFGMALGSYMGLFRPYPWLALSWPLIIQKYQIWRLFSWCFYFGEFSMGFLMLMLWLIQYGSSLEKTRFLFQPADYVFMLLFGVVTIDATYLAVPSLGRYFPTSCLVFMIIYVWSRHNPNQMVSIWGLFTLQSFYLPFAFMGMGVILGGSPIPDLLGIVVGHLYWFLTELYPLQSGRILITTPDFLKRWVADLGIGAPPPPSRDQPAAPQGFRAFRGPGMRLGAS